MASRLQRAQNNHPIGLLGQASSEDKLNFSPSSRDKSQRPRPPADLELLLGGTIQDAFKGERRKLVTSPDVELVLELHPAWGVGHKKK